MMKRIGTLAGFFVLGYVVVRLYKYYKGKKSARRVGSKIGQLAPK